MIARCGASRDSGPPDDEGRAQGPPNDEKVVTTPPSTPALTRTDSRFHDTAWRRHCTADTVAGLHRRRLAAARSVQLPCGHRDPLGCLAETSRQREALSEHALDAWADTVAHLAARGLTPIVPPAVRQALDDYGLIG
jgi:hypothetical protein